MTTPILPPPVRVSIAGLNALGVFILAILAVAIGFVLGEIAWTWLLNHGLAQSLAK